METKQEIGNVKRDCEIHQLSDRMAPTFSKVAIMQPNYLPWIGFFQMYAKTDLMVWLDDALVSKGSFANRNRILARGDKLLITVPISRKSTSKYCTTEIDETKSWRTKHSKTIQAAYAQAPHLTDLQPIFEIILDYKAPTLADLNIALSERIAECLHIHVRTIRSSSLNLTNTGRSGKLVNILEKFQAKEYFVANGSVDYMVEDRIWCNTPFHVSVQQFQTRQYSQLSTTQFVSHLSIIDAIALLGWNGTRELIDAGENDWIPFPAIS